jgi:hypothetical protein
MKISLTPPPERSRGQHCPSVVLGLLEAGKPQDTLTGGMAYPALEKTGSKCLTASCSQDSRTECCFINESFKVCIREDQLKTRHSSIIAAPL